MNINHAFEVSLSDTQWNALRKQYSWQELDKKLNEYLVSLSEQAAESNEEAWGKKRFSVLRLTQNGKTEYIRINDIYHGP